MIQFKLFVTLMLVTIKLRTSGFFSHKEAETNCWSSRKLGIDWKRLPRAAMRTSVDSVTLRMMGMMVDRYLLRFV